MRRRLAEGVHRLGRQECSVPHSLFASGCALLLLSGLSDRVELFHSDFTLPVNQALVDDCLARANLVFVFLLPSDMDRIVRMLLQAIRGKVKRHRAAQAAGGDGDGFGTQPPAAAASVIPASAVPAIDAASFPVAPCPCAPSLRMRVASWTFSLSSGAADPLLVLPLRPSHSVQIESAHTSLHLYDLCGCTIYDHDHTSDAAAEEGHAARISRDFAVPSSLQGSQAAALPGGPSDHSAAAAVDVSSIPWGHALNTSEMLRARWAQVSPRGLFVEADLRIKPSALARRAAGSASATAAAASCIPASAAVAVASASMSPSTAATPFTVADVCFAHDAGVEGEPFLDWYATLLSLQGSQLLLQDGSESQPQDVSRAGSGAAQRPLGLKLDFKCAEAVAPVLAHLCSLADAASAPAPLPLASPHTLWLNADVLPGPGFPADAPATVEGSGFLRECTKAFPSAVLSVGWVTRSVVGPGSARTVEDEAAALSLSAVCAVSSDPSPSSSASQQQYYTDAHVSSMLDLLRSSAPSSHQVTFPLRASLVAASWRRGTIQRLLASCPWATLTIWTSKAEQQRPGGSEEEQWIARTPPRERTFIDLVLD